WKWTCRNCPGTNANGAPSARTKPRWATVGASMRRDTSLSGNWTMAKAGLGQRVPGGAVGNRAGVAYTNGMPPQTDSRAVPALQVRDLRKTYDNGVEALKGVSLEVQPGDFFAMLGPNGAGKSTLIGIVTSLVNKTSGDVHVFGVDIARERDAA